jgi:hypothetical protein
VVASVIVLKILFKYKVTFTIYFLSEDFIIDHVFCFINFIFVSLNVQFEIVCIEIIKIQGYFPAENATLKFARMQIKSRRCAAHIEHHKHALVMY